MTLRQILKIEIRYWLPMVVFTYLIINGYLSGWSTWIVPDLHVPMLFKGDPLSYGMMFQRQTEGFWYFENMRAGYPFVSTLYDFPMGFLDAVTVKILGFIVPKWYAIYTLFVVTSFVLNAVVCYAVTRVMGISILWSIIASLLFNFVPFHFYRIGHVVYTIYIGVPLAYYMAWQIWQAQHTLWHRRNILPTSLIGFVLGGFNIYYAVFSLIIMTTTTAIVTWRDRSLRVMWRGIAVIITIMIGVISGFLSPFLYMFTNPNTIPLSRPVEDSVYYALWPIGLFSFVPDSVLFGDTYFNVLGIAWNEFQANSILGSLGVVLVLWGILSSWLNRPVASFMRFLGFELGILLMYCTVGGGGLIISLLVTSIIRGTNRFAIFAMFIGIVALMWSLQQFVAQRQWQTRATALCAVCVLLFGIGLDNPIATNPLHYAPQSARVTIWEQEQAFFRDVELRAGAGAAVYQLPALAFPENDPEYRQTRCAVYTRLFCSHGNAFGRDGVLFYYMLAHESIAIQRVVLSRLGFSGVIIDRTYPQMANVERAWRDTLGYAPAIESVDRQLVYYVLPPPTGTVHAGRSTHDVLVAAQFLQAEYALRTQTDIRTPIDFTKPWLPGSVKSLTGVYDFDAMGRWSNAGDFRNVVLTMNKPLPQKFNLDITALAWNRNINAPITVIVGKQRHQIRFTARFTTQSVTFMTDGTAQTITIIPAYRQPASARDARFLALLLQKIQITPQ